MPRLLSRGERIVDLWVNGLAIVAGFVGVIVLMAVAIPQGSLRLTVSLLVYSFGLLAMVICSAVHNGRSASPRKDLLRRLDHAAIFMMIAGTYTPFLSDGGWGRWLLLYVWAVAGVGVILKLIWLNRFERLWWCFTWREQPVTCFLEAVGNRPALRRRRIRSAAVRS